MSFDTADRGNRLRYQSRFSKLFMSHLDAEFKKQSLTSVKSLITDQVRHHSLVNIHSHIILTSSKAAKYMAPSVIHVDLVPKRFRISWKLRLSSRWLLLILSVHVDIDRFYLLAE